jgi:hypothetical protein
VLIDYKDMMRRLKASSKLTRPGAVTLRWFMHSRKELHSHHCCRDAAAEANASVYGAADQLHGVCGQGTAAEANA